MRLLIARNPDGDSSLPYLLRIPLGAGLILKARDTWPRTARVYCHRADAWPDNAEIVEDVPVLECRRRGVAIDLVLDRPRENRSQLVFTKLPSGREGIFWQTRKVVTTARPGARIPGRRIADLGGPITVLVDTREQYPYKFAKQQATVERMALDAGDYAVRGADGTIVAAVERKALADLASGLNGGTIIFEMARLAALRRAAVVVEDRYASLLKLPHAPGGFLADMVARVQVRYPEIPIVFVETRALAEEWTFRWLGAALVEMLSEDTVEGGVPRAPAGALAGAPAGALAGPAAPAGPAAGAPAGPAPTPEPPTTPPTRATSRPRLRPGTPSGA